MINFPENITAQFWKQIPQSTGVYFFLDQNEVPVYIGKALNIRDRLKQHITNTNDAKEQAIVRHTAYIKWQETASEFEALVLEANLVWKFQPTYNAELKDDKSPIYIIVTQERFGKIRLERKTNLTGKERCIFGPLPSARLARHLVRLLRHIYPFCTEKKIGVKPCFYHSIGLCNPCPNEIVGIEKKSLTMSDQQSIITHKLTVKYQTNIRNIIKILTGNGRKLLAELETEMGTHAQKEEFEEARIIRDRIYYLQRLFSGAFASGEELENPEFLLNVRLQETSDLMELLGLKKLVRVECYDISNFSFDLATASMVVFENGDPAKEEYRRFRIKGKRRFDPEMLLEVLERRMKHTEWPTPDLLVLDGGTPQVFMVYPALKAKYPQLPALIGIAKGPDRLLDARTLRYFKLPYNAPALHYIQRLRDEAHRFAKKYHLLLRNNSYGFSRDAKK